MSVRPVRFNKTSPQPGQSGTENLKEGRQFSTILWVLATDLGAVEYVVVSVLLCAGGHGDDVRPRAGLGHGQRAHVFAAAQLGKVL